MAKSLGKCGCWIVGGFDSREGHRRSKAGLRKGGGHPTKDSRHIDQLVRRNALPFWGFAISPRGRIHGPWRQLSTASENATYAPTNVVEAIARRNLDVDGLAVLPLVCGEMHSRPIRTRVKEISPHLVLVSGHASHKRAVQGIRTVYNASGAAVVHTQHLVPSTGGAHHWINARGRDFAESINRSKKDLGSAFLFNIAQSYRMGGKLDQAGAVQRSQLCSGGLQRTGGSVVSCSNRGKKGDNRPEHGPVLSGREVFGDGSRPVAAPMAP